jgi:hypothetical protein
MLVRRLLDETSRGEASTAGGREVPMGHLRHLKEEYRELVARLDAGQVGMPEPQAETARRGWQEILEILYTPDEAWLGARMPLMPATLHAIAARVRLPEETLKSRLETMADKGIVWDLVDPDGGETRYLLSPPVVGFFEFAMMRHDDLIPKRRMAEALDAYTRGDDTFARDVFGGDTVIGRTMVHETALDDDLVPDVLDWERAPTTPACPSTRAPTSSSATSSAVRRRSRKPSRSSRRPAPAAWCSSPTTSGTVRPTSATAAAAAAVSSSR